MSLEIQVIDPRGSYAAATIAELHRLICELAEYEKLPVTADAARLQDALNQSVGRTSAALATVDGQAIGYLVWYRTFSTFRAAERLFLEDLYVTPAHRGRGHGRHMLSWLARRAKAEGIHHMQWQVLDWNAPAIAFYEKLGAEISPTWLDCSLTGDALVQLCHLTASPTP